MLDPHQLAGDTHRKSTPNFLAILALACVVVCSPVAIVLGVMAQRQINRTGQRGRNLARLAVILGVMFTIATLVAYLGIAFATREG